MTQVLLALVAFSLAHVTLIAFWAWALRAGIAEVSLGLGPRIARVGLVTLKLVPYGGHVRFLDAQLGDSAPPDTQTHDALPLWKRLTLPIAPLATLMLMCWAALGARAGQAFLSGFEQLLRGALGPMSTAQSLLARLAEVATTEPPVTALALVFSKLCALNTISVLIGPGGSVSGHVLSALGMGQRQMVATQYLGFLVLCIVALPWIFAAAWFAWTRYG